MALNTSLVQLNTFSKSLSAKLKKIGLFSVQNLLFYLPFRYEDYSKVLTIANLTPGEQVTIKAQISAIAVKRGWKYSKMFTEAIAEDETGKIKLMWFGQPFIAKVLKMGDVAYFSGIVKDGKLGLNMVNPVYEKDTPPSPPLLRGGKQNDTLVKVGNRIHTARIVPIYHTTEKLTQKQLRYLISQVIGLATEIKEWLPEEFLESADLVPLSEAIRGIHFPEDETDLVQAQKRLKFGEIFILQLRAEMIRQSLKRANAPIISFQEKAVKEFVAKLPFELTAPQKVASWEILKDLNKNEPMNRLLEGDVGSGKTVVAGLALYNTVLNGYQGVIMAPTEILARQHFESLKQILGDNVSLALLTRSQFTVYNLQFTKNFQFSNDKLSKQKIVELIKNGEIDVVVGTHSLLSDDVQFKHLGLAVVDEQHRFGVEQRRILREKAGGGRLNPHFLSMTATPIPRSFALLLYGDLDLSIINQLPVGRKPIKTRVVEPYNRQKAYEFIKEQVKLGRQVFVICPLIESSVIPTESRDEWSLPAGEAGDPSTSLRYARDDKSDEKKTVMSEYKKLSEEIFPDLKVAYLHGKLPARGGSALGGKPSKESVMEAFRNGETNILVSTSVIEVGVNIPNASVMMIEGAERFGLAQLHQFRGRVGRAEHQSYCLLFSNTENEKALARLEFFQNNIDGFKVAEYDLETRGPGEVYGTAQSGLGNFKLATLKDIKLIKLARDLVRDIDFNQYPIFKEKVKEWEKGVHLE